MLKPAMRVSGEHESWVRGRATCAPANCGPCRPSYLCVSAYTTNDGSDRQSSFGVLTGERCRLCAIVCPRRPTCVCTPERPVPEGVSAALAVRSIPVASRPGASNWRPERVIVRFVRHRPSARCQRAAAASPLGCHDGSRDRPGGRDWRGYPEGASGVSWPASATAASSAANSSDQPLKGIAGRSL